MSLAMTGFWRSWLSRRCDDEDGDLPNGCAVGKSSTLDAIDMFLNHESNGRCYWHNSRFQRDAAEG